MLKRIRRSVGSAAAPVGLLAAVALVAAPASAQAAPAGTQALSVPVSLDCVLDPAPVGLNTEATLAGTFTATAPASVNPGDPITLTDASVSLTVPANLVGAFTEIGAVSASGTVTNLPIDVSGSSSASINGAAGGLPFGPFPLTAGQALVATLPSTGPFTLAAGTATGAPGTNAVLTVDTAPGWTGNSIIGYTTTGNGLVASVSGLNAGGGRVGPLPIVCNPPSPAVTIGKVAIVAGGSSTTTTSSATASSTTTASTSTTTSSTTTTPANTTTSTTTTTSAQDILLPFTNWTVSGSVTAKTLGEPLTLPSGASFDGLADLTTQQVSGNLTVPPFTASLSLLGIPISVGVTFTQVGAATGTIAAVPGNASELDLSVDAAANLGITSASVFGLTIPLACQTATPLSLVFSTTAPALALATGVTFTGTVTLPSLTCGGPLGWLLGPLLSVFVSGPGNPYSISIAPPGATSTTSTTATSTTSTPATTTSTTATSTSTTATSTTSTMATSTTSTTSTTATSTTATTTSSTPPPRRRHRRGRGGASHRSSRRSRHRIRFDVARRR